MAVAGICRSSSSTRRSECEFIEERLTPTEVGVVRRSIRASIAVTKGRFVARRADFEASGRGASWGIFWAEYCAFVRATGRWTRTDWYHQPARVAHIL